MQLNPYLIFDGDCEAAFKFYERCLGAKIEMIMTHGNSPMANQAPAWKDRIMHARLALGSWILMGSDARPDEHPEKKGFSLTLGIEAPTEAERVFAALSEGGSVRAPLQETFWALRFGEVVDRFGVPWMINCAKPE